MAFYIHERHDLHHTSSRRDWKNNAIREIRADITTPNFFIERFGAETAKLVFLDPSEEIEEDMQKWLRPDVVI